MTDDERREIVETTVRVVAGRVPVVAGVTGIANAWRANSPLLVIGGQGPFTNLRRGSLQEGAVGDAQCQVENRQRATSESERAFVSIRSEPLRERAHESDPCRR